MTAHRPNSRALLDALCQDGIEKTAEHLAVLRALSPRAGDDQDESELTFDRVRQQLPTQQPGRRAWAPRWVFGGLGLVGLSALLLIGLQLDGVPNAGGRFKGEPTCCGEVRVRVGMAGEDGLTPLSSRTVSEAHTLGAAVSMSQGGWATLYDVHLATRAVRELPLTEAIDAAGVAATARPFSLIGHGDHLVVLVVTGSRHDASDAEVLELLRRLGGGLPAALAGRPASVDLLALEVSR